jgi:hypothetical protein
VTFTLNACEDDEDEEGSEEYGEKDLMKMRKDLKKQKSMCST